MTYQPGDRVLHHKTGQVGHIHTWHGVTVLIEMPDASKVRAHINDICYQPDTLTIKQRKESILAARGQQLDQNEDGAMTAGDAAETIRTALVNLDVFQPIPELGVKILVETSRSGDQTLIHWQRISRVESRCLTKEPKKR